MNTFVTTQSLISYWMNPIITKLVLLFPSNTIFRDSWDFLKKDLESIPNYFLGAYNFIELHPGSVQPMTVTGGPLASQIWPGQGHRCR